ncbi:hydroxypyruvate isomerase family protein [Planctomicrobium sp. SH661]|uniref:hydroxypyruvate isomerase family protein n=1 Tax=Planctomicrobium sp. SH661 TaxID=3448124 RepID=UPI003F5AEAE1
MSELQNATSLTRRAWIQSSAAGLGAISLTAGSHLKAEDQDEGPVAKNKRIQQSLVHWCYSPAWPDVDQMCQVAVRLGVPSIELIDPQHWPTLKKHGLTCAISSSHGFPTGFNNPGEWERCLEILRTRIAQCADFGVKRVITFTGMANGISKEEGADNCVAGLKKIVGDAEKHDVTLCLEMLNTRDASHPMKGHPGYQGDHCDYCIDILKRVGSSHLKLLFDIYHVQIMDGDVIRRIHEHKDYLGHIHTAGNPGRGELDDTQEIHYPGVMKALLDVGYAGYVGQEFIPTRDPWEGLKQAVQTCDV